MLCGIHDGVAAILLQDRLYSTNYRRLTALPLFGVYDGFNLGHGGNNGQFVTRRVTLSVPSPKVRHWPSVNHMLKGHRQINYRF